MDRREFVCVCSGAMLCGIAGAADPKQSERLPLAACGIDCTSCGIRKAAMDPAEAEREAERWRKRGHKDAKPEWFQCEGCHGDDAKCWSGNCKIRACCLKDRKLANCSLCKDFDTCEHIAAFASDGHKHHRDAVQRLRAMRKQRP